MRTLLTFAAFLLFSTSSFAHQGPKTVVCNYAAMVFEDTSAGLNATFVNVRLPSKLGNLEGGYAFAQNVAIEPNEDETAYFVSYPTANGSVSLKFEQAQYTITEVVFGVEVQEVRECFVSINDLF